MVMFIEWSLDDPHCVNSFTHCLFTSPQNPNGVGRFISYFTEEETGEFNET